MMLTVIVASLVFATGIPRATRSGGEGNNINVRVGTKFRRCQRKLLQCSIEIRAASPEGQRRLLSRMLAAYYGNDVT
jgi:hypothetical protein